MNLNTNEKNKIRLFSIFMISYIFCLYYFNYFETPTADYIGNFKPRIIEYMNGIFPGQVFKIMPIYPLIIALFSKLGIIGGDDPIYMTALVLNIILYIPYFFITFKIYREFFDENKAYITVFFLGINIYTIYTAVNSELEMFLSLFIVLTLYLSIKGSKLAYLTSFFAAATKWDSVFVVPSVMFNDFFVRKKRLIAVLLGALASVGAIVWLFLSIKYGNTYVGEIARRGPNIYRFILDCFLTASSFLAWMGMKWWETDNLFILISYIPILFCLGVFTIITILWGAIIVFRDHKEKVFPIYIFFSGFLFVHLVYQNTKARYTLPILWLFFLFMFYGLFNGLVPKLKDIFSKFSSKAIYYIQIALFTFFAFYLILSFYLLIYESSYIYLVISLIAFTVIKSLLSQTFGLSKIPLAIILLISGTIINFNIYFGINTMDHYSLRRVEFKKAAMWFKENSSKNDRILMTELNVPRYYLGNNDRILAASSIKSKDYSTAISDLKNNKIRYIFVDDFYIRRLKINDKNAIERNAELMKKLKEKGVALKDFKVVKEFDVKGKKGYMLEFLK